MVFKSTLEASSEETRAILSSNEGRRDEPEGIQAPSTSTVLSTHLAPLSPGSLDFPYKFQWEKDDIQNNAIFP